MQTVLSVKNTFTLYHFSTLKSRGVCYNFGTSFFRHGKDRKIPYSVASSAAVMAAAIMVCAVVAFAVMMLAVMIALYVGVKTQASAQKGVDRIVGLARNSAEETDVRLLQCRLRTAADAPADQNIDTKAFQQSRKGAVAAAHGSDDGGRDHLFVFNFIDFELLRMTEVLENLSVLVGYRDFQKKTFFLYR